MSENNNFALDSGLGIVAGYATKEALVKGLKKPIGKGIGKSIAQVTPLENDSFRRAAEEAFNNSGLKNKGYKIFHIDKTNLAAGLTELFDKIKWNKPHPNPIKELFRRKNKEKLTKSMTAIACGKNACHIDGIKRIYANVDKMSFSLFHEMGHAINATSTGIKKTLYKSRKVGALAGVLTFATAMFTNRKSDNDPTKTKFNKFTDAIKDNCGKIMFLSMLPIVIEEGVASLNAKKLGEKVLSKDLLSKMNKLNFKAWGTYVASAIFAGIGSAIAVRIKDKVAGEKPIKQPVYNVPVYKYYPQPQYRA